MGLRVRFCGVRGSTPAPGPEFVAVGGHTSCVAVFDDARESGPTEPGEGADPQLVLDAGTGLQALSRWMDHRPFAGTILLTHLHWDHLQGLPFFRAGDQPDATVRLLIPEQGDPIEVLRRGMSPPHFPIGPDGLQGAWSFGSVSPGASEIEGFEVTAADVPHKGGRTFGYRIAGGGRSFAYLPDHRIGGDDVVGGSASEGARSLCHGVDVLIHDAQFVTAELALADAYGHSTIEEAISFAAACEVGRLVLFHHGPARTDEQLASILAGLGSTPIPITLAVEGLELEV